MKVLLLLSILFTMSSVAMADEAKKAERFEKRKAKVLEHMTQRIVLLNTAKSCIASASNKDAMKTCRAPLKSFGQASKAKREAKKANRKK